MVALNFSAALKRVLVHEGGYSNHPQDPGGVTLEGVIQSVYDADRRRRGLRPQRLTKAMRGTAAWIAERDAIYRGQYWNAVRADDLPAGVDLCVFDGAVNSGPVQAGKWLQRALKAAGVYTGGVDGHIGAATIAACQAHPNHDDLVAGICDQRLAMLRSLRTWGTFGLGWSRRVADIKAAAQAMAEGERVPAAPKVTPDEAIERSAKADERDTKVTETPEGKSGTEQVTTAGAGGLGMTLVSYYDSASGFLAQLSGLPPQWSRYIVGGVIAVALLAAVALAVRAAYGLVRIWLDKRAREKEQVVDAADTDKLALVLRWGSEIEQSRASPRRARKAKRAPARKPRSAVVKRKRRT